MGIHVVARVSCTSDTVGAEPENIEAAVTTMDGEEVGSRGVKVPVKVYYDEHILGDAKIVASRADIPMDTDHPNAHLKDTLGIAKNDKEPL